MILAIDYDGTLVKEAHPGHGELREGAADAMNKLKADGHYLIIWTCREIEQHDAIRKNLTEQGCPFDVINKNNQEHLDHYGFSDCRKVYADKYIDDRGINGIPSWEEIYNKVKELCQ